MVQVKGLLMPRLHGCTLLLVAMLVAGCQTSPLPVAVGGRGEDAKVKSKGSVEVTARLVEIPDGAIFERDLYHYAGILKYEVVSVHRGSLPEGGTIYVGHYDPWKPRDLAAQGQVKDVGGTLRQFEAGRLHRMALETPMDDFYLGAIVDKYFGKREGSAYWAVWTNAAD
jgi:hypothetical protein